MKNLVLALIFLKSAFSDFQDNQGHNILEFLTEIIEH